jgi:hypothetical protein
VNILNLKGSNKVINVKPVVFVPPYIAVLLCGAAEKQIVLVNAERMLLKD